MRLVAVRPGNYIAFFPSFRFLTDVAARLDVGEGYTVHQQTPGMTAHAVRGLIGQLGPGTQPTLVLAVQGGGLAEGVDYPGDALIGAIVVGPAVPSFDKARELQREYYERRYGNGDDYAYTYPAMAKVIQAAGRVIRSERDRGLIVLMDARFVERRYSALMPRGWYQESVQELVSTSILQDVRAFWDEARP